MLALFQAPARDSLPDPVLDIVCDVCGAVHRDLLPLQRLQLAGLLQEVLAMVVVLADEVQRAVVSGRHLADVAWCSHVVQSICKRDVK